MVGLQELLPSGSETGKWGVEKEGAAFPEGTGEEARLSAEERILEGKRYRRGMRDLGRAGWPDFPSD